MTARRSSYIARTVRADGHAVALMFHRDSDGTRTASAECEADIGDGTACGFYHSGELDRGETLGDALRAVVSFHGFYVAEHGAPAEDDWEDTDPDGCGACGRLTCDGSCPDTDGAGMVYSDADPGL